jgi:hypothetical protein
MRSLLERLRGTLRTARRDRDIGIPAGDWSVYVLAAAVAAGMTVASSVRPALRAASIATAITIRTE